MRKKAISKEMEIEQVANYARELRDYECGTIEESLGETMFEACYNRSVSYVIGRLNGRRGESAAIDTLIDTVIARIRG